MLTLRARWPRIATAMAALFAGVLLVAGAMPAGARQTPLSSARPFSSNVVIPQTRAFCGWRPGPVRITSVHADVVIRAQVATTRLDIHLHNPSSSRLESELLVPVPDGCVVRGFTFQGAGAEPTATLLPRDEARRRYDDIVARIQDPALLEFAGYNLVQSSVFPVEAGGTQQVQLTYEHILDADGDRIDYVLPRSESLDYTVPWSIDVRIEASEPVSTLYSPSHPIETNRLGSGALTARVAPTGRNTPGAFRLSYLLQADGVNASLIAYPDPSIGGGYFLLLAGLPAVPAPSDKGIRREVTIVIDRSGSMNGEKIQQVRSAVLQVLGGLEMGETFNIIPYNESVEAFSPQPVTKSAETLAAARKYVSGILPRGGTNIHDALLEALRQKPAEGCLPIVLFLTDGLPTVGQTSEVAIRSLASKANPHAKRIFTFGVGVDVNTPLLEKVAFATRATTTFVLPGEDVEVKVASVFERLAGPVLAHPELAITGANGSAALGRVRDVIPGALPDLFRGDQLVVLGQYVDEAPITFEVRGNFLGTERTFRFDFRLDRATTRNAFVPRLWASRKIAMLVDAIRELGAGLHPLTPAPTPTQDPRVKELVDEIVRLSTEFGILTEYTAFLATEGTDLAARDRVIGEATQNFATRAIRSRTGLESVNQDTNLMYQKFQGCVNPTNRFYDANMQTVEISTVQQVSDRAFYRRGDTWIDSRVLDRNTDRRPREVVIGSDAFREILEKLLANGRQGCVSLRGNILLEIDGEAVLVRNDWTSPDKAPKASEPR